MFATSDLSYIESRLTDVSVSETRSAIAMTVEFTSEITLAPPLLPFPLLVIFNLILYALLPRGVPNVGFCNNSLSSFNKSFDKDLCFFNKGFTSDLKFLVSLTVTFT